MSQPTLALLVFVSAVSRRDGKREIFWTGDKIGMILHNKYGTSIWIEV